MSGGVHKPPSRTTEERRAEERSVQEQRVRAKVACDKAVYEMQMHLVMGGAISAEVLDAAADLLQPHHYDDIVCERGIGGTCGYPGCGAPVKSRAGGKRFHVSLSEHKVFDVEHMHDFCSRACARRSQEYAARLSTVSLFLRKGSAAVHAASAALSGGAEGDASPAQQPPGPLEPPGGRPPLVQQPPPQGPTPAPMLPGDLMVGQIAERANPAVPQLPRPPERPDLLLVEGHAVKCRPTPAAAPPPAPRVAPPKTVTAFSYG